MSALVPVLIAIFLAACTTTDGNLAPSISALTDVTTTLGEPVSIDLTITDESPSTVTLVAASSNTQVVSDSAISITGTGTLRTVTITPSSTIAGTTTVTLTATDNSSRTGTRSFNLTVYEPFAETGDPLDPTGADDVGTAVAMTDQYLVVGGEEYAYVFERVGDGWQEMQKLVASDTSAGAGFGTAVAIDGERIIVGARHDAQFATNGGAAYIFELVGGTWTEVIKLTDPLPEVEDAFGVAVDIAGDYAAVGAINDAQDGVASGSVFMYQYTELTDWSLLAKLRAPVPEAGDQFGSSLDIDDGRLIVGSPGDPFRGAGAGMAHVFELVTFVWEYEQELSPVALEAGDRFGASVAISGDHLLVGAPSDAGADQFTGAAYAFARDGGNWQASGTLLSAAPVVQDFFGANLDLDYPYAVIGKTGDDELYTNAGAVNAFRHDGSTWHQVARLLSPTSADNASFGYDVAIAGELVAATQFDAPRLIAVFER